MVFQVEPAMQRATATILRVWVELPCSRLASAVLEATATIADKATVTATTAGKAAATVHTIKEVAVQAPS